MTIGTIFSWKDFCVDLVLECGTVYGWIRKSETAGNDVVDGFIYTYIYIYIHKSQKDKYI